jgi:energy-coupling factor transporter transmembrane protein EcfT
LPFRFIATLAILAGISILGGGGFGRVIGYIWAVLVIVQSFAIIGIAPWYAAFAIILAVLVIYGLASAPKEAYR